MSTTIARNEMKKIIPFALASFTVPLLGGSDVATAQSGLEDRLAAATRVDCRFTALATGRWDGAEATATLGDADLETSFFDIDVNEGTAEADSALGAMFIVVRYSHGYLHFLEMSDAGPLHVTTVLAQETVDGRMKAVHTRHEYSPIELPGFTSRPEMYVGDCAVEG
ncbi:MAG TPA: hypothetical protein VF329_00285 [Gammaproteobacteria bacterium]